MEVMHEKYNNMPWKDLIIIIGTLMFLIYFDNKLCWESKMVGVMV